MRKFPFTLGVALVAASAAACAHPATRGGTSGDVAEMALPTPAADSAREQTADQQVKHVLNRLAFGPRPGDYERVRATGVDRWVDAQLHPERIDDQATDQFLAQFQTLGMSTSELARAYPPPQLLLAEKRREMLRDGMAPRADSAANKKGEFLLTREDSVAFRQAAQKSARVFGELATAKVARAVMSNRQLEEVMTDFWENHFNVFAGKGPTRYMLTEYDRDVIRPHALGKFRDLLGAVAKSPAMLYYLDNWESTADSGRPRLQDVANRGAGAGRLRPMRPGVGVLGRGRRQPPGIGVNPPGVPSPVAGRPALAQRRPVRGLNENYGRELLELHTLGVDGGYTQQDVINAARALTGWTIQNPRAQAGFVFRPQMHDAGEKVVLGHKLAAGRGIEDGEELLDIVARHPATARFIATKLVRRFVSDSPPPALVARAAETFRRTDGDIRAVLRTIFTSPEFFSDDAYRAKVKSPFELVVSALRAVGARPDSTPRTSQIIARLGEPLYGHQAPNGYPETGADWINTGAILNRINFGLALAGGRIPGSSLDGWPQGAQLATAPRDKQVDGVVAAILGGEASPDTRKILESGANPFLERASGAVDSTARTVGADTTVALDSAARMTPDPMMPNERPRPFGPGGGAGGLRAAGRRDPLSRPADLHGFAQIVGLALGAPEFQRR